MPVSSTHELYILYTSGSTGRAKGIVRDTGSTVVGLNYMMDTVYATKPGHTWLTLSDMDHVISHIHTVYGPLLRGATSILYERKPFNYLDEDEIWRVVEELNPQTLMTHPTLFRHIKSKEISQQQIHTRDLSSIKHVVLICEKPDPSLFEWIQQSLPNALINDVYGSTETGQTISGNFLESFRFKSVSGSATKPVPGSDIHILTESSEKAQPNEVGHVVLKYPYPPSFMTTLWKDDEGFIEKYCSQFPGYFSTGDLGYFDENGYLFIQGRSDDVIKIRDQRISSSQFQEVINSHEHILESAVIAVNHETVGNQLFAIVLPSASYDNDENKLKIQLCDKIFNEIGGEASLIGCVVVSNLPKTESGKIQKHLIQKVANNLSISEEINAETQQIILEIVTKIKSSVIYE